jgi:hypothetical protein
MLNCVVVKHYRHSLAVGSDSAGYTDNACAKNFFGLLKTEMLYLQEFTSVEHFIKELHGSLPK